MAFCIGFYAYAIIVHTRADQRLPQLAMEQFDTFPIQCRHIEPRKKIQTETLLVNDFRNNGRGEI